MLEVARSVDATPDLIPVLDELFAGMSSLGSATRRIATLVERFASPGPRARVLDLACGKGAVGVELAARTGCRVVGVDACEPFLTAAREAAERRGVVHRCLWVECDVRTFARDFARLHPRPYDAGMMIGLLPLDQAARVLGPLVRPGGVYIIDDVVLDPTHPQARRFRDVPDKEACSRTIERLGDRVEHRVLLPRGVILAQSRSVLSRLRRSAASVAAKRPVLRRSLEAFLARQEKASALLVGALRPTIWVMRRL
jgi:SAM-dependent methyltransferase